MDVARLDHNIAAMQARADRWGARLKPHLKTHKSFAVATRQLLGGAAGFTCAKPFEAAAVCRWVHQAKLSQSDDPVHQAWRNPDLSVTLAYPWAPAEELSDLVSMAQDCGLKLEFVVDSFEGLRNVQTATAAAAAETAAEFPVWIKVDVGLGRCGVAGKAEPGSVLHDLAVTLVAPSEEKEESGERRSGGGLRLRGLLAHAGHSYGAADRDHCASIAEDEVHLLQALRAELGTSLGTCPPLELSVGATPTDLARDLLGDAANAAIDEIRPGNYVFLDRTPLRLGVASIDQVSLTVLATVVSVGERHVIIDSGSKVLSSDGGAHGSSAAGAGFGLALPYNDPLDGGTCQVPGFVVKALSEEHGWLSRDTSQGGVDPGTLLQVGDRVRILPNHSCPVANLASEYIAFFPSNAPSEATAGGAVGRVEAGPAATNDAELHWEAWPIEVRGSAVPQAGWAMLR